MVSEKTDMLDEDEARPSASSKIGVLADVVETGEATVELVSGKTHELHDYDTHFYYNKGVVFTVDEEDAENWFFTDQIVNIERH